MQNYFLEARQLLALAIPVFLSQIAQTAMGFVDTVMAGAVSATDMAAVAVGTSIWLPAILFGHGLILALTPVVAQLNGAGLREKVAYQVRQAYWLAGGVSILIMVVLWNADYMLNMMQNVNQELTDKAIGYLRALSWGVPGYLFFQVVRNQCEGLSKTKPSMVLGFVGLLINIPVNYIFIYGHLGVPAMGSMGCGVATSSVYWVMFILMRQWAAHSRSLKDIRCETRYSSPDWHLLWKLTMLGLPIALAFFFEVTLFALVSLLISPTGITNVAGHQIALNFSSLAFVLPLSIGVAAAIRVGYRIGQKDHSAAKTASWSAQGVGIGLAIFTAVCTLFFREQIARIYSDSPEVIALAAQLMLLASVYQISDAIQVVGCGVLRGYKDTRSIFFITFFSYWMLGLPIGYLLGLTDLIRPALGPLGFWIGFIIGLTSAAIMILARIIYLQKLPASTLFERASG